MEDVEKIPDGDTSFSTIESRDCKEGHLEMVKIDDDGVTAESETALPPLRLKRGLFEKIEAKCDSLPCKIRVVHILLVVVAAVWGLLSLPIIIYHLPLEEMTSSTTTVLNSSASGECSNTIPYPAAAANSMCLSALEGTLQSLNCEFEGLPFVLRGNEETILNANLLNLLLGTLNPSPQCTAEVVPVLCLYLFSGVCGSSDETASVVHATAGQCLRIRDELCVMEWQRAMNLIELPDCDSFPLEQEACEARGSVDALSGSGLGVDNELLGPQINPFTESVSTTSPPLPCRAGFYREDPSGICLPSCHSWKQDPESHSIFIDVVVCLAALTGLVAAIAVIVISLIRYKRMFVFPSVIIVYETIILLVLAFFVLVNYMDRSTLFCSSVNFFESRLTPTPFCVISGMMFTYALVQLATWWLLHTVALFWKIKFPFHARSFEVSQKIKYLHCTCVLLGLLLPLVPVIASVADAAGGYDSSTNTSFLNSGLGFAQTRYPPILCTGIDGDVVFYSVVLPIDIALAIGCSLLIYIFWMIHKQHGLFKANKPDSKNRFKIGTAERKVLIVFCYYIILAVVALTAFTISTRNESIITKRILEYFTCEQNGHDPDDPCSRSKFEELNSPVWSTLSYILLGMFPMVNLIYAVNVEELKTSCQFCVKRKTRRLKFSISDNPSTGSSAVNSSTFKKV